MVLLSNKGKWKVYRRRSSLVPILGLGILLWIAVALSATRGIHRTLKDEAKLSLPVGRDNQHSGHQNEFGINRFISGPYKDATKRKHIQELYGCKHTSEGLRPIYTEDDWVVLREAYQRTVGKKRSTIDAFSRERSALVPLYVKHTASKGRGVFAAKPIKKGQAIYTSRFDGWFEDWDSYRVFLGVAASMLPKEAVVCDLMEWTFHVKVTDQDGNEGSFRVVELDEGALSNSGGLTDGNARDPMLMNPDDNAKPISYGSPFTYAATKDIGADEEILAVYTDHGHVHEFAGKELS